MQKPGALLPAFLIPLCPNNLKMQDSASLTGVVIAAFLCRCSLLHQKGTTKSKASVNSPEGRPSCAHFFVKYHGNRTTIHRGICLELNALMASECKHLQVVWVYHLPIQLACTGKLQKIGR
ncbi:hypothetical protein GMA8713_02138 [Grimontia marina]|uniref:Uncharacterized protein n=1 Tax=Grimontia marina TaxID=646534 RepID=A0A128F6X8_9GAMM|nr:hypothetical protein GMA8713_02138 [Grimontia marina]